MKDETGKIYGHLTVLEKANKNEPSNRCIRWICQCDCGRTTVVNGNNLRTGRVSSCGQCGTQQRGKHDGRFV